MRRKVKYPAEPSLSYSFYQFSMFFNVDSEVENFKTAFISDYIKLISLNIDLQIS